jgi:hypothetical protein
VHRSDPLRHETRLGGSGFDRAQAKAAANIV